MGRAKKMGHATANGNATHRYAPQGAHVDVLAHIAMRQLDADLRSTPRNQWPGILAERQVAPSHVRSLAAGIGLRLTTKDLRELRQIAATALADHDLDAPASTEQLATTAGAAMRAAIAGHLAHRCSQMGTNLLRRATGRRLPDPPLRAVEPADWRALILEQWLILPIMRPVDIAGFLRTRLVSAERAGGPLPSPSAKPRKKRPATLAA
jgi:hypothetical protein